MTLDPMLEHLLSNVRSQYVRHLFLSEDRKKYTETTPIKILVRFLSLWRHNRIELGVVLVAAQIKKVGGHSFSKISR
jgi:hypothetical protein